MQLENIVYHRTLLFAQQFFMKSTKMNFRTSGPLWGESAVDSLHEGYVINVITACCYTSNKYISSHGFKFFMLSSPKQCLMHNTHTHTHTHIYIYIYIYIYYVGQIPEKQHVFLSPCHSPERHWFIYRCCALCRKVNKGKMVHIRQVMKIHIWNKVIFFISKWCDRYAPLPPVYLLLCVSIFVRVLGWGFYIKLFPKNYMTEGHIPHKGIKSMSQQNCNTSIAHTLEPPQIRNKPSRWYQYICTRTGTYFIHKLACTNIIYA